MTGSATAAGSPEVLRHAGETATEAQALALAVRAARLGPAHDANPRVGCVLLGPEGRIIGIGWHRGAGTPHAEIAAIAHARSRGAQTRGATAIVTLEPCAHTGRTGPCAQALLEAGIARLAYAVPEPSAQAAGGARLLREHGVPAQRIDSADAAELVRAWAVSVTRGTPYLTLKMATTLDGRVAAADGTSRWITGPRARQIAHRLRAEVGAIIVGTGTVLADDPELTARLPDGTPAAHQPLRVVAGLREPPPGARVRGSDGRMLHLATRDPRELVTQLAGRGIRHALVEGGPRFASALVRAGVIDEVRAFVAPVLLGDGPAAIGQLGIRTISDASRWRTERIERAGDDMLMIARRSEGQAVPGEEE